MKRGVLAVLVLGLLAIGICWPAFVWGNGSGDGGYEPTRITDYRADFRIDDTGRMRVTERIVVDFGFLNRHGIFRFWDLHDPNAPQQRREPTDVTVLRNGEPEEVDWSEESMGRYQVARIGSANRTVNGEHAYLISYTIDEVLLDEGDHSRFYWNLIPGGWAQAIDTSRLTVTLPGDASALKCAVGVGATGGCTVNVEDDTELEVRTGPLQPRTPVTLSTDVAVEPPAISADRPWSMRWDPVLGPSLPLAVGVVVLALLAAAAGRRSERRTHEKDPQFPLVYAPPEGIGPAQADFLLREKVSRRDFIATILYLAERGVVRIDRGEARRGATWTLTPIGTDEQWKALDPVSRGTATSLGLPSTSFRVDGSISTGQELKSALGSINRLAPSWGSRKGLVVKAGPGAPGGLATAAALVVAAIACFAAPATGMSLLALVPGAYAAASMGWFLPGAGTVRTPAARDLWSRVGGFRRILATPSSRARFEFSGRRDLYAAYLPWAVAFGVADEWARKYRTEVGEEPPAPSYLGGVHPYMGSQPLAYVDQMISSFDKSLDSAISAYEASIAPSSSSGGGGGGGGGFSGGGGGGGGGGGSW